MRLVATAPTLVKYASANPYLAESREELTASAAELRNGHGIDPAPVVDLRDDSEPLEVELATSLLYPHCHYSYRQLRANVAALTAARRDELIALGTKHRGRHDELLRSFSAGQGFRFDILMDIGGFRDMHRHRRCVQLLQGYTDLHGYDEPTCPGQPTLAEAKLEWTTRQRWTLHLQPMRCATQEFLRQSSRRSTCFRWGRDAARCSRWTSPRSFYIAELRSGIAGHLAIGAWRGDV